MFNMPNQAAFNMPNQASASNGLAAVLVGVSKTGSLVVLSYAPADIGNWKNRATFAALVNKAALKLGFSPDRRCKQGYRKIKKEAA